MVKNVHLSSHSPRRLRPHNQPVHPKARWQPPGEASLQWGSWLLRRPRNRPGHNNPKKMGEGHQAWDELGHYEETRKACSTVIGFMSNERYKYNYQTSWLSKKNFDPQKEFSWMMVKISIKFSIKVGATVMIARWTWRYQHKMEMTKSVPGGVCHGLTVWYGLPPLIPCWNSDEVSLEAITPQNGNWVSVQDTP